MGKKDVLVGASIGFLTGLLFWGISLNLSLNIPYLWLAPLVFPLLSGIGTAVAMLLSKRLPVLFEAAKFLLVGGLNTFVDLGILNLLIFTSGVATGGLFTLFKAVSFTGAVLNSYLFNKFWTFEEKEEKGLGAEFTQFVVVSLAGFLLNVGTATLMVNAIGPQFGLSPTLWANVGALAATFVAMTWNFLGYKLIVFKS